MEQANVTEDPLEAAERDLKCAEANLQKARDAELQAQREVERAIAELHAARGQYVFVNVLHVNEVERATFAEKRSATLRQVWERAYIKLEITQNPKDIFQTAGDEPKSLMSYLGLTLEQAHTDHVIEDDCFGIVSETGGA